MHPRVVACLRGGHKRHDEATAAFFEEEKRHLRSLVGRTR